MKHCINSGIKKFIGLILLVSCSNSNAFIYLAIKYVKTLDDGRVQTLWLLSDIHIDNPANDIQVRAMLDFAQQLQKSGFTVKFIVEDTSCDGSILSMSNLAAQLDLRLPGKKRGLPIQITNVCKQKDFTVSNIECRWNEDSLLAKLPFTKQAYDQFLADQQKIIKEIESYRDNEVLNAFYKDVIKKIKQPESTDLFGYKCESRQNMTAFLEKVRQKTGGSIDGRYYYWDSWTNVLNEQVPPLPLLSNPLFYKKMSNIPYGISILSGSVGLGFIIKNKKVTLSMIPIFISSAMLFNWWHNSAAAIIADEESLYNTRKQPLKSLLIKMQIFLIDARILHQLSISPQEHIFIAAGGAHIEQIMSILEQLGYKRVGATGPHWKDGNELPVDLHSFFDLYHPVPELRKKNKQFQNPKTYSAPVCLPRVQ